MAKAKTSAGKGKSSSAGKGKSSSAGKGKAPLSKKDQRKNGSGGKVLSKQKRGPKPKSIYNVYEDSDDDKKAVLGENEAESYEYKLPANFEDEEISEDEAFNDSDFEKYGDIGGSKMRKGNEEEGDMDVFSDNESDNDEEDDDNNVMDLSDLLGGSGAKKKDKDILGKNKKLPVESDEDEELEDDDENDDARHTGLLKAIGALDGKARNRFNEKTETAQEGEFGLSKNKVQLSDLMASLKDTTGFGGLKKQLAGLQETSALSIPMAKPAKARINRNAAFEDTKEDVSKWTSIVKRNREAEHLSFPLNPPRAPVHSTSTLTQKFTPETEMEQEIAALVAEAGDVDGNHFAKGELIAMQELSVDEIKERRKQLAKMRALMSYYELKRQRINKIKSKTYHRKLKKEKERNKLQQQDMEFLDDETRESEQMKAERMRAEERMTLRHKNTSQWAKRLLQRGENLDPKSRAAIEEQLRLGQQLRRKITLEAGSASEDEDGEDASDTGSDVSDMEDDEDDDNAKERNDARIARINGKLKQLEQNMDVPLPSSGLLGMKFMQRALEKQRQQAQRELEDLRRQLERENGVADNRNEIESESESDDDDDDDVKMDSGLQEGELQSEHVMHSRGHGTMVAGFVNVDMGVDGALFKVSEFEEGQRARGKDVNKRSLKDVNTKKSEVHESESEGDSDGSETSDESEDDVADKADNPWLAVDASTKKDKKSPKSAKVAVIRPMNDASESDEAEMEEDSKDERGQKRKANAPLRVAAGVDEDDSDDGFNLSKGDEEQRKLIERAFANDNVVEEFEEEKRLEEGDEDDAKKAEPVLPGWGSWGGEGLAQKKRKTAPTASLAKPKAPAVPRKDANLPHVIINEKRDKKAAARLVKTVPHTFETRDQYERAIRNPVGKEWNTPTVVERNVRPTISTKAGAVIQPMNMTKEIKMKKAAGQKEKLRTK